MIYPLMIPEQQGADIQTKVFTDSMNLFLNNATRQIKTIEELHISGGLAGRPILTYNAKIIYIPYNLDLSSSSLVPVVAAGNIEFRDTADGLIMNLNNYIPVWDTTAAAMKFVDKNVIVRNIWFTRIIATNYDTVKFQGLVINLF